MFASLTPTPKIAPKGRKSSIKVPKKCKRGFKSDSDRIKNKKTSWVKVRHRIEVN